ncbi:phage tail sheath subtilisin-like domain-containing protein [Pseudacidovorax intermedius]|uniref:phage tail sheath subtilisin-like domain-containing protein n=1 Tax=Pseudacidovorax intermedius TaxID=433924 RepID=UPI0026E92267|nr:phage tail sheath subtilisin-like domain-containing protein [Pseudacidovorax intermedius]
MPDNISFNTIPMDIRVPGQYVEVDNINAVRGLPSMTRRILVLGNRLASGSAPALSLRRVNSGSEAAGYFGRGSVLHEMLRAMRAADKSSEIWAMALDDLSGGVAATKTVTLTGPATASGTISLYLNGQRLQVGVSVGDTASTVATAIAAAVNAYTDGPCTATAAAGVATLVARHKGLFTNDIDVRANYYPDERLPAGLTLVAADGAAGTGNPDVATALAAITTESFYTIVTPYTDTANVVLVEAELGSRWGGMDMRTGHAFGAYRGTQSALATWGSARNSPHDSFMGVKSSPTPTYVWAAVMASVCEMSGSIDPARPFQTLVLPGVMAPAQADQWTWTERNLLLRDGISTFTVDQGGNVLLERAVTTYQTNAYGIEDVSYLDLEPKWTVDYMRYAFRARVALRYPRHKLADDGTAFDPGQAVVTPNMIRGELLDVGRQLETAGLLENFAGFKKDLRVVRSMTDRNRVNALLPPDLVNQFRVFAASVQFIL